MLLCVYSWKKLHTQDNQDWFECIWGPLINYLRDEDLSCILDSTGEE